MKELKKSRLASFLIIAGIYILAVFLGAFLYTSLPYASWLNLLLADIGATVFTYFFSVLFANASVYDPYWSVQPIVIVTGFALAYPMGTAQILLLAAVWIWGLRLTANWALTFYGLEHQDWRYTMLRETTGAFYPVVNFLGIHLFPTLVVYACVLPAVFVFETGAQATFLSGVFFAVSLGAAVLQFVSDRQMLAFRRLKTGGLIRTGLWKYSRHPNYLGEILMWWGVAGQAVCVLPDSWWMILGASVNTLMFIFISIPMADRRQSAKPGYEEYAAQTRMLLPFPRRS
ncbi:MAG: DUF1295 domain-containing protein [Lachnospiraceae bacterium]|nr:DUF1295 domain-containing protein [Lachnospiraceae bacterium]